MTETNKDFKPLKLLEIKNLREWPQKAHELAAMLADSRHIAFEGSMGAGKTTLIAALCREWGVGSDDIASPTFSIVNEYVSDLTGESIYHFDFYRIEDLEEARDMGLDDYLDSGRRCLMEWSDRVEPLLPDDLTVVTIEEQPDGTRRLTVSNE